MLNGRRCEPVDHDDGSGGDLRRRSAAVIYWLLNKPAVADFMIAAEGELKKVNWSSRKEVAVSTLIVIVVVFVMAALLGATDMVFQLVFRQLIG